MHNKTKKLISFSVKDSDKRTIYWVQRERKQTTAQYPLIALDGMIGKGRQVISKDMLYHVNKLCFSKHHCDFGKL